MFIKRFICNKIVLSHLNFWRLRGSVVRNFFFREDMNYRKRLYNPTALNTKGISLRQAFSIGLISWNQIGSNLSGSIF